MKKAVSDTHHGGMACLCLVPSVVIWEELIFVSSRSRMLYERNAVLVSGPGSYGRGELVTALLRHSVRSFGNSCTISREIRRVFSSLEVARHGSRTDSDSKQR